MGKVSKKASEKHNVSLSPAIAEFITKTTTLPLIELPTHLSSLPTRWPFPRGDLYNWIEALDRFDGILENFVSRYGLNKGPQAQAFGASILLDDSPKVKDVDELKEYGFGPEGDRELVESILSFSKLLLDKCGNRALYNSTERLNDLLNTTSPSLLHDTLRLTTFLALRYADRNANPPSNISSFYNFDNDRFTRIAAPFTVSVTAGSKRGSVSTAKRSKSRDRTVQPETSRQGSSSVDPNNFRLLVAEDSSPQNPSSAKALTSLDEEWQQLVSVKVVWSPALSIDQPTVPSGHLSQSRAHEEPTTPTPSRRQASSLSRTPTSSSLPSADVTDKSVSLSGTAERSGMQTTTFSASDLLKSNINEILQKVPVDMPAPAQYELLNKLRVAYALMDSSATRKQLLENRLLALTILAYVNDEHEFPQMLFGSDANSSSRYQLVQQIVSLVQDLKKDSGRVSMYVQTLAIQCLGVLARQRTFSSEITTALSPNSGHGLLLSLTQRALEDIQRDGDDTDNKVGDDWRESIFLLLLAFMNHSVHSARSSEAVIHSSLIVAYASGLRIFTDKALRIHLRILDFMKTFSRHFKDGLQVLSANHAFEAACEMLDNLSRSALELLHAGRGIPQEFKTQVTDYKILYMHQQVIRSMIDQVNDIFTLQGANAERILRNLVDSQPFLNGFRLILSNIEAFGVHTWSEVVKAIVSFLHNEPTSYTIISEAGIINILLGMVSDAPCDTAAGEKRVSAIPEKKPLNVPPVTDAIVNLSQAFGAVCLTTAGFDNFKASGALEKFFQIFESPEHVKVIKDANTLALLGSTFDELVRHHPPLRNAVLSNVITMIARVRYICRAKAWETGAGPKLWIRDQHTGNRVSGGLEALSLEVAPQNENDAASYQPLKLPNGNILEIDGPVELPNETLVHSAAETDVHGLTVIDYARPAICFLMNFFENQQLCTAFMEAGASDLILDFTTMPTLPPNELTFGAASAIAHELTNLIHMMAETKPAVIVPAIVDRALYACEEGLTDFLQSSHMSSSDCYFAPFVQGTGEGSMEIEATIDSNVVSEGTKLVKSLTTALLLVQVLSEIFNLPIFNVRASHYAVFASVNLADVLAKLCRHLGMLSAICFREEIALQAIIPESWLSGTRPENFSTGVEEVDRILSVVDNTSPVEHESPIDSAESRGNQQGVLKQDEETAAYKNAQTLRYLLIETPNSVAELFQRLGRGIAGRRRMDTFQKQKAARIADALAEAYITQLRPSFLPDVVPSVDENKRSRFSYLVVALSNVRGSLYDDSPSLGPGSSRQAFVVDAFRRADGLTILSQIGTEFFDELRSCQLSESTVSANAGLKICLDIADDLCSTKNIVESTQAAFLRSSDHSRPFYFNPAQLLLELRMDLLPLICKIWNSDYADQASNDVVQKLVSVLKHVFNGEHENEAIRNPASYPSLSSHQKRKFTIPQSKLSKLIEKGYSEDLAREAIYRSNATTASNSDAHEEYCKALKDNPRRRRLPIPADEVDVNPDVNAVDHRSPPNFPSLFSEEGIETTFAEIVSSIADNEMDDIDEDDDEDEDEEDEDDTTVESSAPRATEQNGSAMDLNNILNRPDAAATPPIPPSEAQTSVALRFTRTVEGMDAQRDVIRKQLPERCNNILNNHQNLTFELSELMVSASKKLTNTAMKEFWDETADLLVMSLLSMQDGDPITEARGKKVAAAAHLTALLIQDNETFKYTLKIFQEAFDGLLSFLGLPPVQTQDSDESTAPWVAPILLIIERMLSLDAEPPEIKWHQPTDHETSQEARLTYPEVLSVENKNSLFDILMNLLPRVGKDKSMALSIVRVLVTLTRNRDLAVKQSQKGNMQKLFLMVKQLGSGAQGRLQNSFMLILRHIIEDDEIVKQIMRSDIVSNFVGRSSTRQVDLTAFVRDNYHLALRCPELFVEIANEKLKLINWTVQSNHSGLALRSTEVAVGSQGEAATTVAPQDGTENAPATSVEADSTEQAIISEAKPPIVEHQDGVVHFLLSELLAYKDIDDKEQQSKDEKSVASGDETTHHTTSDAQVSTNAVADDAVPDASEKQEKPRFKADDHPIFMYRCFILHCLTELLYSYNRTKVEFISFSRKSGMHAATPSKSRSSVLNYLLTSLVCSGYVDKDESIVCKKKMTLSDWAIRVLVALCWKTGETESLTTAQRFIPHAQVDDKDTEPDLSFVRKFTLDHAIKAFRDAVVSTEPLQMKYSRLLCLGDLFHRLLQKPTGPEGAAGSHNTSYAILGRMMFEKNLIAVLTSSLAEIDLAYGSAKKVIKFVLRPLQELTTLAAHLSVNSPEGITSAIDNDPGDLISSSSSVNELDDIREETPDLFRNSALGMLDPSRQDESDTSEDDDEDEEMYDEEYEDEMEYDDGMAAPNDGEVVSEDEVDETLDDVGPIEGIPGDQPMDIEFVMDDHLDHSDSDSEGDSDDEDDEDDDDDDDDPDNDDFEIEMADDDIDAENDNDSLDDGHDGEEEWEDEEEDDEDDVGVTFEGEDLQEPLGLVGEAHGGNNELNNLLRVLGDHDIDTGPSPSLDPGLIVATDHRDQIGPDDDDDDDADDADDLDENEGLDYDDGFNAMLDGDDLDESDQWGWDEPPPAMFRRHRHASGMSRGLPFPVSRRIHTMDPEFPHVMGGRHHRHAPPARNGVDHTTNPLLQRPDSGRNGRTSINSPFNVTVVPDRGLPGMPSSLGGGGGMISMQIPLGITPHHFADIGGHGAVLDALLQAVGRNGRGVPAEGFRLQIPGPPDLRELMRSLAGDRQVFHHHHHHHHHHARQPREDPSRVASFTPMLTANRWQEEARMIFGNTYIDKIQRVQLWILSKLVPLARQEEKERLRKRAEEEEQRKRDAKEVEDRRLEEERLRKEQEEREAAEKAAAEAKAREEAEAAATAAESDAANQQGNADGGEAMEGVQTDSGTGNDASSAAVETERIYTAIRGRQVDITDLEIDREYLDALPEDLREEVIMQQYAERRQEAQDDGGNVNSIDQDFLDALPEDIREEIRQQEAHMQRRREREEARRQHAAQGMPQAEEMDNDNFLATLDPAFRRTILAEQPPEILSQLDPRHAAEGRAHQRGLFFHRGDDNRWGRDDRARREAVSREKRQVVQLIDKAGVATLLRLMFLPTQGSLRQNLWHVLSNVCGHRQTRYEVISLLLVILKEGSTDVSAVERSLASLSLRAKANSVQKTPQSLKRTMSTQLSGISDEVTPLSVVQQCLSTLQALCRTGFHVKGIFLREVDVNATKNSKRGKGKESKTTKYPLNDVIALLDRRLIMESSSCLQALAELLAHVTGPLPLLLKKDKSEETVTNGKQPEQESDAGDVLGSSSAEPGQAVSSQQDTAMAEAPAPSAEAAAPEAEGEGSASAEKGENEDSQAKDDADAGKKPTFEPPAISPHNLRLITSVFVTPECHNETFHNILETVKNLSTIPDTSVVFSQELIGHVRTLSSAISSDLDELLPLIREAQSTSDLQGITSAKFSAGGSDQVKLLRVLQALDFLSAPKKEGEEIEKAGPDKSILNESYSVLSLGPLWQKLSECLTAVREKGDTIGFANILLALIESLMVVCKNTPLKDAPILGQATDQPIADTKTNANDDLEDLFFNFTTEHRKILNDIVRQNPKLMQGHGNFSLLVKNGKVLDFDNKRNYFTKQIHARQQNQRHVQPPLQLLVKRDNVFLDSYKNLYYKSAEEMKYGKLNIRFQGEEGVDAGGVTREWFQVLARGMFDPNYVLFLPVASDRTTFHPNNLSGINPEHLQYFKFIGRIIGKALHEGRVLDCHFSRAVYKRILGKSPNLKDLESNDVDYYKSLVWILENDITDILTEEFCVVENRFGVDNVIDLIPDGRNIAVTEDNKKDYVQKLVEYRLTESVKEQLDSFLQGFHDIIPAELVSIFNEQELELLISGLPEIDVDDWKANTEYHNYSPSSPQVTWFWRIVRGMTNEERAKLLQFITGTSKVPLNGFKELEGVSGLTKFNVHKDPSTNRLPTSHTCFNQLDLPAYENFEITKQNLMTAINLGADYFGFA